MDSSYIIREATVVSVNDDYMGMRIKVKLCGLDGEKKETELADCFPLLPKLLHVTPKVGECVLVIFEKNNSPTSQRFFIGPVLSQPYFYNEDLYDVTALNMTDRRPTAPRENPTNDSENNGTLPDYNDVAVLGRKNTDIILKEDEIRIRSGFKKSPDGNIDERLNFNFNDPAYIQLKYKHLKDKNNKDINSFINVVADRINLLSRDSIDQFTLTDQTDLIDDSELLKILETAHPVVYGDELVSFLKQLVDLFQKHTHPFSMLPPSFSKSDKDVLGKNLDVMLSQAVSIN